MKIVVWRKWVGGFVFLLSLFALRNASGQPSLPPPPAGELLNYWLFDDTNLLSGRGFAPSFSTNLTLVPSWNNYSLQMDDTNPSILLYPIIDTNSEGIPPTNIAFTRGSIEVWFSPDWDSGTGPGNWGTLLEAGTWDTNLTTNSTAWGLYFSPDGTTLNFAAESGLVVTNYFSAPISWDAGDWHYIILTYDATNTNVSLYLEGQLATNIAVSLTNGPNLAAVSNVFSVGSDGAATGLLQARGQFSDLVTYNYALDADSISNYYAYMAAEEVYPLPSSGFHADDGPSPPGDGGGGGGGTNFGSDFDYTFDTNGLWLSTSEVLSNVANIALMNSVADVLYEIQTSTNLAQTNWFTEGFVYGSELSNWTALNLPQTNNANLFVRVRSWADTTGTGIPDWWWLLYFGQTTNVDGYAADPTGDGYTDLQKFQLGVNPSTYYNTNAPGGFFGCLDATGTNVFLEWSASPGPVTNYQVQRGILNTNGEYDYAVIGNVSSNTTYFEDAGAISNANAWNNIYTLVAQYPAGIVTAADTWYAYNGEYGSTGAPYGAPVPGNAYAYAPPTGTNVLISWTPATPGASPTNYIVERGVLNTNTSSYTFSQIAGVNIATNYFQDVGVIRSNNDWNDAYEVIAVFPGGVASQPATASISTNPPGPTDITAAVDTTGTNVRIAWSPPQGIAVSNYVIERGVLNTNTDTYSYTQIATVGSNTTSFQDAGAITSYNSYNNAYEVEADIVGEGASGFDQTYLSGPPSTPFDNLYVTANLIRNQTGRWQIMFSALPTNTIQTIQLTWLDYDYAQYPISTENISTTNVVNGVYPINDSDALNNLSLVLGVQLIGTNGNPGPMAIAGILSDDAPYFVDGRQHLAETLKFLLRGAGLSDPYSAVFGDGRSVETPNFVEASFMYHTLAYDVGGNLDLPYLAVNNLWPFTFDYELYGQLFQLTNSPAPFSWQTNFTTIPVPPELTMPDPYWISLGPNYGITEIVGGPVESDAIMSAWGITHSNAWFSLANTQNLYGLGLESAQIYYSFSGYTLAGLSQVNPGQTALITNFSVALTAYTQASNPVLQTVSYYFAPVNSPGALLPWWFITNQIASLPLDATFAVTNQTPFIVGTVGQPMRIGGWAKQQIVNGAAGKFAYLGQYFQTNSYLLATNGSVTTNDAGIVSPYGDFFPMQAGVAQMTTMPDITTAAQGTNIVRVISLNVDANHDGTMDFSYSGPDQNSTSRPMRFWVADDDNSGDFGGTGEPGVLPYYETDGSVSSAAYMGRHYFQGRRALEDCFPVYLNVGSLFQSNSLSAGINPLDTNYQFVLSQADGALRFAYTDLTSTNYMNFLRDTNESGSLAYAPVTTITTNGVTLPTSFLNSITVSNQGVILLEAWKSTTQPLVLSIYRGTNLFAQTSLYLSISGVEQMFRHKNILLRSDSRQVPDRLTDADVPNEPDTTGVNFVFLHGYNVNPTQARGWDSDIYKRLYWSGSHAKFYGVTWEGSDSQVLGTVSINLQTNIVNAFNTAPLLNSFLNGLNGTNILAAHSLGNMLVLSTLNDQTNQNINTFFMIDAAVAIEAIQGTATPDVNLYYPDWIPYADRLNASHWWQLWPTNDARSTLTWSNRLANLQDASVYNFYSSGEEVLREYTNGYPPSELTGSADEILFLLENEFLDIGEPAGAFTWSWQEMLKGRGQFDSLLSSDHGGWQFNPYYETNIMGELVPMSPADTAALTTAQLQTNTFLNWSSGSAAFFPFTNDLVLESSSGSSYAQTNRNRILSDAIPCLTLPIGANPVPRLQPPSSPAQMNFDMEASLENGWPLGRPARNFGAVAAGEWHHSDCRQVAYTFTHRLFDEIVTLGDLK